MLLEFLVKGKERVGRKRLKEKFYLGEWN